MHLLILFVILLFLFLLLLPIHLDFVWASICMFSSSSAIFESILVMTSFRASIKGLEVLDTRKQDRNSFYMTMKETADRNNISIYSKDYYLHFYKDLHQNNHSDIYDKEVCEP